MYVIQIGAIVRLEHYSQEGRIVNHGLQQYVFGEDAFSTEAEAKARLISEYRSLISMYEKAIQQLER